MSRIGEYGWSSEFVAVPGESLIRRAVSSFVDFVDKSDCMTELFAEGASCNRR